MGLLFTAALVVMTSRYGSGASTKDPAEVGGVPGPVLNAPPPSVARAAAQEIQPGWIQIPRLGATAPIVPVQVRPDRSLEVPDNPRIVGWWAKGPKPGAVTGTAVLDGHVNTAADGPGVLVRLNQLRPSDIIEIGGQQRMARFVVTAVREYPKRALPADAFPQNVPGQLAIVTCGGPFDHTTGHYRDNIIVYAVPA